MSPPAPPAPVVGDTDVVSFLFHRDPVRGPRYAAHLQARILILLFAVVGEMLYGTEERRWGRARRQQLEQFIRRLQIHERVA